MKNALSKGAYNDLIKLPESKRNNDSNSHRIQNTPPSLGKKISNKIETIFFILVKKSTKSVINNIPVIKQATKNWNTGIASEVTEQNKTITFNKSKSRDENIIMEEDQKRACCKLNACPIF